MTGLNELSGVLDKLCPMHVLIDPTGHIHGVGPTLQKLRPGEFLPGRRFLELFELRRPRGIHTMSELLETSGVRLRLSFRDSAQPGLKGLIVPLPGGSGAVANLSFGISVLDAVRDFALTSADFSATDLAVEMLYLVEAKSAAMESSRKLNLRLQGAMIAAEERAFTDTLTGLKNRRAMDHVLDRLTGQGVPFALMHLDLDFFKAVNDTLGHAAGDHVLQEAARIMVRETRENDMVARVGGDEFVLIFDGLQDRSLIEQVAGRLIGSLEEPMLFNGKDCRVSASIGTTFAPVGRGNDPAELLHEADLALYAAKRDGRGCHRFFDAAMPDAPPDAPATHNVRDTIQTETPPPAA